MNTGIPNFTESEYELVAELLRLRYQKPVRPELADSELKLAPDSDELTLCPTLFWSQRGAQFVVCKTAPGRFRCQFFYSDADQYGTGHPDYTDLRRCVQTLLRVQADHESQRAGISSGVTAATPQSASGDDDYHAPLII